MDYVYINAILVANEKAGAITLKETRETVGRANETLRTLKKLGLIEGRIESLVPYIGDYHTAYFLTVI